METMLHAQSIQLLELNCAKENGFGRDCKKVIFFW